MKVEIRPLELNKWHGKTGDQDIQCAQTIYATVNSDTNRYETGLDDKDIEQLKKEGVSYDLSSGFNLNVPHPFWESPVSKVTLENHTTFFNTDNPMDRIKYKLLLASKFVANSKEDLDKGKFPEATHIIYDEIKEDSAKAQKIELKKKAYGAILSLSHIQKLQLIMTLYNEDCRNMSDNRINIKVDEISNNKPKSVIEFSEKESEYNALRYLVLLALKENVIRKEAGLIKHFDCKIGTDIDSTVDYLSNAENQVTYIKIKGEVEG